MGVEYQPSKNEKEKSQNLTLESVITIKYKINL